LIVLGQFLVAILIVGQMTYVIMPRLTKYLANWIY